MESPLAIGPTSLPVLPPLDGNRGSIAAPSDRGTDRIGANAGQRTNEGLETVFAEPLDDAERRQFDLERTADQVRQLNPNAPRGTILNILV
jgi:hypothetical protein